MDAINNVTLKHSRVKFIVVSLFIQVCWLVLSLTRKETAHWALATQKKLACLGFQCLDHPPYSPDLASWDYHLFPGLKKQLKWKQVGLRTYQHPGTVCACMHTNTYIKVVHSRNKVPEPPSGVSHVGVLYTQEAWYQLNMMLVGPQSWSDLSLKQQLAYVVFCPAFW
jgi:hypothetical protein